MTEQFDGSVTILVPCGSLGAGVREEEVARGLAMGAQVIASDAGSTDSGAAYLAKGTSKNTHGAVKRDLTILMAAARQAGIPLVIGTCGQAGGDLNLDWTAAIVAEVAAAMAWSPKVALLYAEQDKAVLKAANANGRIAALPPLGALDDATIDACDHIVAALGPEPYIAALEQGADIVLGGRTTDTAVIASYALMKGAPAGACWHAGKVSECGAVCSVRRVPGSGVIMTIDAEGFEIEPLSTVNCCTVASVSGHMLYENSDPFRLHEPGGVLDVTHARYEQVSERRVRVTGAVWDSQPYTMKLEGASGGRFQTIMLVGIEDPVVLADLDTFHDRMLSACHERVAKNLGDAAGDYHLSLRLYGWNAVSGQRVPPGAPPPREVGVLFVATAATQVLATQIARTCNPVFFHMAMPAHDEMPSYGFAFSPADIERGAVYEFRLNHVIACTPFELVRTDWLDGIREEAA